jgi:hypothetical protein
MVSGVGVSVKINISTMPETDRMAMLAYYLNSQRCFILTAKYSEERRQESLDLIWEINQQMAHALKVNKQLLKTADSIMAEAKEIADLETLYALSPDE